MKSMVRKTEKAGFWIGKKEGKGNIDYIVTCNQLIKLLDMFILILTTKFKHFAFSLCASMNYLLRLVHLLGFCPVYPKTSFCCNEC